MNERLDIKAVEKISKALGDPYRVKIVEAISKAEGWTQCATIVDMFDLAQSTISHHVSQLVGADLLLAEKDGRNARYKINKEVLSNYVTFLTHLVS